MNGSKSKRSKKHGHHDKASFVVVSPTNSTNAPFHTIMDEEYAAELADPNSQVSHTSNNAGAIDRTWGWIAIIVSVISLFFSPAILGSAGVILGLIAFFRGNRSLGGWSMAIGLVSVFSYLFIVPYYA
ncbi:MAG: hypothetical protein JWM44_338 [Bacilli bacterium]|nr:hypothetical protein [Bacilli bacterium]